MSHHQMSSPSKKVRHESAGSHAVNGGNQGHGSPAHQSSVGANFDTPLLDFPFETSSPSVFYNGVPSTPLSYLPSHQQPSSRDWSPSVGNTTSVPENFSFPDTMSPGPVPNGPSRAIQSNAAHGQEVHQGNRGQHKRGAGVNRRDPYISTHDTTDHSAAGQGFSSGIALAGGDAVLDEESQEHLSTNLKTLTDRINKAGSRNSGRFTPDVGMDDHEGTRHGFHSSIHAGSQGNSAGPAALPAFPFSGPSSQESTSSAGAAGSSSLFDLATFMPPSSRSTGLSAPNSTRNIGFSGMKLSTGETEKGHFFARSMAGEGLAGGVGASGAAAGVTGVGGVGGTVLDCDMEVEDGGESDSNMAGSQQSGGSSMMSGFQGLAAITAAAESLPFPADTSHSNNSRRNTPGKKAQKSRTRAFNGTPSSTTLTFPSSLTASAEKLRARVAQSTAAEYLGPEEHSQLTFETGSSGNSGNGSGGGGGAMSGVKAAAQAYTAYGTPAAAKLTGSMLSAASSKPVSCNCKRSRCLKMYCDCFRLTTFCRDSCRCKDCANVESKAAERQAAIDSIVDRNPEAFKPRVTADPVSQSKGHLTGCHCRKSSCLKKYCECFTGAVPCGERCRCIDCKNAASIYGSASSASAEGKQRLILTSSLSAGVDRSQNPRKDSISSDSNMGTMDVMSAIMHDKRQFSSLLSTSMQLSALGQPLTTSLSNLGTLGNLGGPSMSYYDPEMSNLSTASLNYSNDGYAGHSRMSQMSYVDPRQDSRQAFSPPRQGTEASSGANSNRSILDNEEAAEVLSVMNSPNAYMPRDRAFGSSSAHIAPGSLYGKSLLHEDFEDEGDDSHNGLSHLSRSLAHTQAPQPADKAGGLCIETEAGEQPHRASSYQSPPSSSYNSPIKPRRASTIDGSDAVVMSPMQSLLNLAGICAEKQEEEQKKSQLNSPVFQRS